MSDEGSGGAPRQSDAPSGRRGWQRFEVLAPIAATLITAVVSGATVMVREISKTRALELESLQQQSRIYQDYLTKAIEVESDPVRREVLLSFFAEVVKDPEVRAWAKRRLRVTAEQRRRFEAQRDSRQFEQAYGETSDVDQRQRLQGELEAARKRREEAEVRLRSAERAETIANLIDSDAETRWNAAESLSTVWGSDSDLLPDLIRFLERIPDLPEQQKRALAYFNVVVVLEDLEGPDWPGKDLCDDLLSALDLVAQGGGSKAKVRAEEIRGRAAASCTGV